MESRDSAFVLGQRYMLATVALVIALLSFLNLAGLEKAIVAIILAVRALRPGPGPQLDERRSWARLAVGLATAHIVLLAAVILLNLHRLPKLYEVLRALSDLK
jgi:hypothetical protein